MGEMPRGETAHSDSSFSSVVAAKAARKLRAQRRGNRDVWSGLGMSGLIGWSVALPTLLGAAIGLWLDKHHAGRHSWTLALLMAGLAIGCWNAWHWVAKEQSEMHEDQEDGVE